MTKYYKEEEIDDITLFQISNDIKNGKTVVFKTDTVYGIGTNAFDEAACKKVYEVKKRPIDKPLCVLISDLAMLNQIVAYITPSEQKLMDAFWPGPLTIKFRKKANVLPDLISAGDDFVRVRLMDEGLAHRLIKTSKVPIVAPSANLSGNPTGINIHQIMLELNDKVDYVLDSGNVNDDSTSTIVSVVNEKAVILREGRIKKQEIANIIALAD